MLKKYNIGLVLNENYQKELLKYCNDFYAKHDSNYTLGVNANPHITICQFLMAEKDFEIFWEDFHYKDFTLDIHLSGLTILPSSSGGAWIEISVLKNLELLNIQERIAKKIGKESFLNGFGDKYRPHITIAHLPDITFLNDIKLDYNVFRSKGLSTKLSIGEDIYFKTI